jgi:DNA uptake protein ComE-like DNA-binding protein
MLLECDQIVSASSPAASDPDPLAGATIVVHAPSPSETAPAGSATTGAGLTPSWNRLRVAGGVVLLLLCFALYALLIFRGREPAPISIQSIGDPARGAEIRVHVTGAVSRPGVHRLAQGDRLEDAVRAAGGLVADADADRLNLAQRVRDEQRIDIPFARSVASADGAGVSAVAPPAEINQVQTETTPSTLPSAAVATQPQRTPTPARPTATSAARPASDPTGKVNVNTASQAQLERLPGIGEVSARRIVAYRTANGPLRSPDDLRRAGLSESIIRRAAEFIVFE